MIMSSNDKKGNLVRCYSYGIDHYLVKPYDIKELYEAIKSSFPHIERGIPADERETVRKDIKILVVEDNKMNQKVIGTMLKSLGYSFDFADDGFAGLIQAKTRRYDVIFMDLIMPQMDGFESARRILEHDSTQLIVAFTADNMPESKRKAELSGIRDFIPKPVRIEDLKRFFSGYFNNK
jgi:CheY-like chemotaxis protein